MIIFLDILSVLPPTAVLENCLETPELKSFSTSCAKLRCPLFVQKGSFPIGKPWIFSATSKSFKDLLSCLTFTCSVLFVELFHLYLFVALANVADCLNHIFFLSFSLSFFLFFIFFIFLFFHIFWVNITLFFHMWTFTHILQFYSGTVSLDIVTVTQCSFIVFWNYKPPCYLLFHTSTLCYVNWQFFLLLFWEELFSISLCECLTNILCVPIIFV